MKVGKFYRHKPEFAGSHSTSYKVEAMLSNGDLAVVYEAGGQTISGIIHTKFFDRYEEVKEETTLFLNIYRKPDGKFSAGCHTTKADADTFQFGPALARVEIKFKEGDGL